MANRQDRLSSLDLSDRRTGATRSQIANFFCRGACVRGLTNNSDGVCGSGDETILLPTGKTLPQVQNRVSVRQTLHRYLLTCPLTPS